jgi:chromosome segregation ATPase
MNFESDTNSGQDGQKNQQTPMQGPQPAAKVEVEQAEEKAEEGRQQAEAAHERCDHLETQYEDALQRNEELRREIEELRHELQQQLDDLDRRVLKLFEDAEHSEKRKSFNGDMPPVCDANRDPETKIPTSKEDMEAGSDA